MHYSKHFHNLPDALALKILNTYSCNLIRSIYHLENYKMNVKINDTNECLHYSFVMAWKRFSHKWQCMRGIHRSPVDIRHKTPLMRSFGVVFDVDWGIICKLKCGNVQVTSPLWLRYERFDVWFQNSRQCHSISFTLLRFIHHSNKLIRNMKKALCRQSCHRKYKDYVYGRC